MDAKATFIKSILDNEFFTETLEEIRTSVTNDILNTKPSECQSRDDTYFTWKGAERFVQHLTAIVENAEMEDREVQELEEVFNRPNSLEDAHKTAIDELQ